MSVANPPAKATVRSALDIRGATDAEAAALRRQGWAWLRGLVSPATAQALLAASQDILARARALEPTGAGRLADAWFKFGASLFEARQLSAPPFPDLILDPRMGQLAARLIGRARLTDEVVPIRSMGGLIYLKTGSGDGSNGPINFHQDSPSFHADRAGLVTIWIALDEVTPEQGAMRFLEGSHREGSLGDHRSGFALDRYPKLAKLHPTSPPLHYAPGDATAHEGFTLHASPENATGRDRWGLLCLYLAADVTFDDSFYVDNAMGFPEPFEKYPLVYP